MMCPSSAELVKVELGARKKKKKTKNNSLINCQAERGWVEKRPTPPPDLAPRPFSKRPEALQLRRADRRRSGDPAPTPACANGGKAPTAPSCKPSLIMALIKRRSSREQACAVASAAPASGAGSGWDVCVPAPGVGAAWVRKGPESREQRSGAGSASPPMPSSGGTPPAVRPEGSSSGVNVLL